MFDLAPFSISSCEKVAIAVSGGRDSMCLLSNIINIYQNNKNLITALIVDHKLRDESTSEALRTKSQIEKLGVKASILTWEGIKPEANIHEQARSMRYKLMLDYCNSNKISHLLLGHNKDDQAETIFHRIYRGTGISGLCSMRSIEKREGINIIRPMLNVTRAEVTSYMRDNNIDYIDDPSNLSEKYERVKIRKFLNSHYDSDILKNRLCLLSDNAKRNESFIQSQLNDFYMNKTTTHEEGYLSLSHNEFSTEHEELRYRLIAKIIDIFSKPNHPPRLSSIIEIDAKISQQQNCVLGGVEFLIIKNEIFVIREKQKLDSEIDNNIWDKRFKISGDLLQYKIASLNKSGYDKISNIALRAKIYATIPAVYDKDNNFVACPLLNYNPKNLDIEFACLLK